MSISSPSQSAVCSATNSGSPSGLQQYTETSQLSWTWHEEKIFEKALSIHDRETPDRWAIISSMIPGKDAEAIQRHFDLLVEDINSIDSGKVSLPSYPSWSRPAMEQSLEPAGASSQSLSAKNNVVAGHPPGALNASSGHSGSGKRGNFKSADQERRKGIQWTEEEHRLFLLGLDKCGKGDWRSISRNFVISRTPTQVASHAQKYFIRLNSINKDRRRSSIHDITSVNGNGGDGNQACQGPITGQGMMVTPPLPHPMTANPPMGATVYGAPLCPSPMVGPGGSTIGMPVPLQPAAVAGPYVTRASLLPAGTGLPCPSVSGVPVVYAVPQQQATPPAVSR